MFPDPTAGVPPCFLTPRPECPSLPSLDYGVLHSYVEYVATVLCRSRNMKNRRRYSMSSCPSEARVMYLLTSPLRTSRTELYGMHGRSFGRGSRWTCIASRTASFTWSGRTPCAERVRHPACSSLTWNLQHSINQLGEDTEALAHPPAHPAHTVSEVVGETVTSLLAAVMETPNKTASS
ncbi:hypothetical protein SKAU_G00100600 [Synaphobranchus kaupii]|uniref:Uncharacterized protein n=1 Tax=Synaphobranchus kaupii TaxID=118154 RepID=A0A9Q1FYQ4_SYNKA|nr:hypothetical protein SKAU_G00100600 [Synaphobranchus kaupii]